MNRSDLPLLEMFDYYMNAARLVSETRVSPNPTIPVANYEIALQLGTMLADNCRQAQHMLPRFKDVAVPTAPSTELGADGQIKYSEIVRPGVRKLENYVLEMLRGGRASASAAAAPAANLEVIVNARKSIRRLQRLLLSSGPSPVRIGFGGDRRHQTRVRLMLDDLYRSLNIGNGNNIPRPPVHPAISAGAVRPLPASDQIVGKNGSKNGSKNGTKNGSKAGSKAGSKKTSPGASPSAQTKLPNLKVPGDASALQQQEHQQPYLYLRTATDHSGWVYDRTTTNIYLDALSTMARDGLSFAGKTALLTGAGKGSIGAEVLRGLLAGGANVIVTTSSFSLKTTEYYRGVYERSGARGAALIVVPFNQASVEDTKALVDYIYDPRGGLGWDLDFIVPFAAMPENGREMSDIDSKSELAHRLMLTNVLRLLGAIKTQKESRNFDTRPAQVLLPLSPNHGVFGGDGLYGESKAGLETLFNRWHSESWGAYITIVGSVIGWTRGTGLMSANNIVAEGLEKLGVRTFSTQEMAFNLLGLMHPAIARLAQYSPVWADLNGGLDKIANVKRSHPAIYL